ncbi:MAG TPA: enoyl-CoA hydratase/isomerase family protein, partial [bacterium]|nr:enoyl-CoA hydratase/isomerase family protein [bacterium]
KGENTMSETLIKTKREGAAFVITLNRPDKRNAMTNDMMNQLEQAVISAAYDREARAVVIHGDGKCFCSGIDFNVLAGIGNHTPPEFRFFLAGFQGIFNRLEAMEKPVIATIHGYCFGMGTELALAADFRIASEDAAISIQEVELGLIPDVGGTTRLTRTIGASRAKEMIMLARKIDARRAYEIGLVNEVTAEGAALDVALSWAEQLKNCAPLAVGMAKRVIDRGSHLDKMTFMELEGIAQSTLLNTADVKEGVMARIQKRNPNFKGK